MNYKRRIVELLIMEKQPVTSKTISMYLDVSQRSVISYISQINASKNIIFSVNNGYVAHKENLFDYLENSRGEVSAENRQDALTIRLLVSETPLNLYDLSDEFFISESTTLTLISQINKSYASIGIKVVRNGDNLLLKGTDENRRQLLRTMMNQYQGTEIITIEDIYTHFKPSSMVDNVINVIHEVSASYHLPIDDFLYVSFVMHCCIAIYSNYDLQESRRADLFDSLDDVHRLFIERLESLCDIELNDSNVEYILGQFDFAFYKREIMLISDKQQEIIDDAFERVNQKFGIHLSNQDRSRTVDAHILAMIQRTRSNKLIFCPLTETIKRDYMILFEVGIFIASELERKFNLNNKITEHEIALLTIHINNILGRPKIAVLSVALVIPDRIKQTEKFLEFFEKNFLSELKITAVVNHEDAIIFDHFDLIFSVTGTSRDDRVTQLDIFDLNKNITLVGDAIESNNTQKSMDFIRPRIPTIFEPDLFLNNPDVQFVDKYHILDYMTNMLIDKGYIGDETKQSIIERENKASTRFGNIAIPHEFNATADVTKISVLKSEHGFVWDNGIVKLVILITIKNKDREHFHHFLTAITKLIDDDYIAAKQFGYEDFIDYITF